MRRIRAQLTYANVMATIAVVLALGGGAAYAASKLKPNSVKTKAIKNNAVTTTKIADGAVTSLKIANGAVATTKLANNAATGAKVAEDTLRFGCAGPAGAAQFATGSFCAFRLTPNPGKSWIAAGELCRATLRAAHLPTAEQLNQVVAGPEAVPPFTTVGSAWTSQMIPAANALKMHFLNGIFLDSASVPFSDLLTDVVCVYDPADKNG